MSKYYWYKNNFPIFLMPADCDEWERNCYWLNGKIIVVLLKSLLACHADNWRSVCSVSCSEPLSNDFSRKWLLTVQFHDNSHFYNILSSSSSSSASPLCVPPTNESTQLLTIRCWLQLFSRSISICFMLQAESWTVFAAIKNMKLTRQRSSSTLRENWKQKK